VGSSEKKLVTEKAKELMNLKNGRLKTKS